MIEGLYLLLGTNLGDKKLQLERARNAVSEEIGTISTASSIYETAAWGKTDQPSFLNQVLQVRTELTPTEILYKINAIEEELGRIRVEKWGERQIDIDILYYDGSIIDTKDLQIPHPGIPDRRFTLVPLVEIAADFKNPVLNMTNRDLLENCPDSLKVNKA